MRFTNDITSAMRSISGSPIFSINRRPQQRFLNIFAKPKIDFYREEGTRVKIEGGITKSMFETPRIQSYRLELTWEVDSLVDAVIGFDEKKVKINGFEYERMDVLMKLMNLKVLLRREDILRARIRMLEETIGNEDWEKTKELVETLNLPKDIELFLLAAIAYRVTNGKPQGKIRKIADTLYLPEDRFLFEHKMRMFVQQYIKKYVRKIPPKDRVFLRESPNIKERIIGFVWDSNFKKVPHEEVLSKK